jgi:uncharacterized PurR-regulated membrane protein YhhQ (DUF165 family)
MTDVVNEFYGPKAVRRISYIAVGLISYAYLMFFMAMNTSPAEVWVSSSRSSGVPDMQSAFSAVFGQGIRIIIGSLVVFMFRQIVE